MSDNNKNLTNCDYCDYCDSCYYCDYCDSCYSCYYCDYCDSCYSCDSCDSCYSCDSCDSCYSCDYCYSSKGLRMSENMLFCLGDGRTEHKGEGYQKNNRIFNVDVTDTEVDKARNSLPTIKLGITKWVVKDDMTAKEKKEVSGWETMGGYLKRYSYEEAWANVWAELSKSDKQKFLDLPHFDKNIFRKITGIDVEVKTNPREIEIDGATYVLQED